MDTALLPPTGSGAPQGVARRISTVDRRSFPARIGETLLARMGPAWLARATRRGRSLIIAYHNIIADDEMADGDRSLHLRRSDFRSQLVRLRRRFQVVPLGELLRGGESATWRVAITFDDAYRGALTLGVGELEREGLPATIFVAPGVLGRDGFWWDQLAAGDGQGLDRNLRDRALVELGGEDDRIRAWACKSNRELAETSPNCRPATLEELADAERSPLVELGSHSWSHPNLTRVGEARLFEELGAPIKWLQERFHSFRPWLSYPYGLSDPHVAKATRAVGYEAAFRIQGGWLPRGGLDRYDLPRLDIPAGVSSAGFDLRISGLLGA